MKYYSSIIMTEILSFVTTWIDLDNIVCGEVSLTDIFHLYVESKKQKNKIKLILQRKILQLPEGKEFRGMVLVEYRGD